MSSRSYFRRFVFCSVALSTLLSVGCNPLAVIYFLFLLPPPKVSAQYEGLKKETVVVLADAGRGSQFEYAAIDNDLTKGVVRELRDNVDGIKLADPAEVKQWVDEHNDCELTDVGKAFKATRVVYLEIENFTLFEQHSGDLYRGKAKIHVQVADIEKDGDIVWETFVESVFPVNRPLPATDLSRDKFRLIFLKRLTREVAHNFFEYRPDENFEIN
jgi:hypothetical protein